MASRGLAARLRRLPLGAVVGGSGALALAVQAQPASSEAQEQPSVDSLDVDGVGGRVYGALINRKVNACPMAVRVAWHASGTYDEAAGTGGSNGGTMRFEPERSDPANSGLFIIHDLLLKVKLSMPELSFADLWTLAGCKAVEFMGGPRIPFAFGRVDAPDRAKADVPPNGLLPDASQGAQHLREVFGRMGFNDRDIVALSGGHTVGRCHKVRSGYDGAWTKQPLKFDNEYFVNLMTLEWKLRDWDGPLQYTDVATETLTMLPTDMALKTDPIFRPIAQEYADCQDIFFKDFSSAFARLVSNGCPARCQPKPPAKSPREVASAELRELAMHGSLEHMQRLRDTTKSKDLEIDVESVDDDSGRSALHKASFWGHAHVVEFLTRSCLARVNESDYAGDTPLHDAARFGHVEIVRSLLRVGADCSVTNIEGHTPLSLAQLHEKPEVVGVLVSHVESQLKLAARAQRKSFLLGGKQVSIQGTPCAK